MPVTYKNISAVIFDISGRIVKTVSNLPTGQQIDIPELSKGIFFLKRFEKNGTIISSFKILKE